MNYEISRRVKDFSEKPMCYVSKSFNASRQIHHRIQSTWSAIPQGGGRGVKEGKINFQSMSIKCELMHTSYNKWEKIRKYGKIWAHHVPIVGRWLWNEKVSTFQVYRCSVMENENFIFRRFHHTAHTLNAATHLIYNRSYSIYACIINETFCVFFDYAEIWSQNEERVWLFNA